LLDAYLAIHRFPRIYIADLNALAGHGTDHLEMLQGIVIYQPEIEFWVDAGLSGLQSTTAWRPVVGTESIDDPAQWQQICRPRNAVLSLDYRNGKLIGPSAWQHTPPACDDLIIMELDRVGSGTGPGLARAQMFRRKLTNLRVYAAGGVRNSTDLNRLAALGFNGVLVATALQQGWLQSADLSSLG
jgi:phosphoribosylformimino-5-aminoimidazole carboxamide ribotide isomerase